MLSVFIFILCNIFLLNEKCQHFIVYIYNIYWLIWNIFFLMFVMTHVISHCRPTILFPICAVIHVYLCCKELYCS